MSPRNRGNQGFGKLTRFLRQIADQDIDRISKTIKQQIVSNAVESAGQNTPVDTSRAVSNWSVSLTVPVVSEREPFSAGIGGSTADSSISAMTRQADAVIARIGNQRIIYLSNSTSYIEELDGGSSNQAPTGFSEQIASDSIRGLPASINIIRTVR